MSSSVKRARACTTRSQLGFESGDARSGCNRQAQGTVPFEKGREPEPAEKGMASGWRNKEQGTVQDTQVGQDTAMRSPSVNLGARPVTQHAAVLCDEEALGGLQPVPSPVSLR